ncbi:MAG: S-layer homology domain-containing protein [Candidatus Peribacteraceae bacterium]|nr:S-layer homology domain-containing protein [Candidatus Peribacteraceae bacterium]
MRLFRASTFLILSALAITGSSATFAASDDTLILGTGEGTVIIQQVSPIEGIFGEWTLIKPFNKSEKNTGTYYEDPKAPTGSYTIVASPPEGAKANVEVFLDDVSISISDYPQASFTLSAGQKMRVVVTYIFTQVGTVTVMSEPAGLNFTLRGPNGRVLTGITPAFYPSMPQGLYTADFEKIEGCVSPPPQSNRLIKGGRISLSIQVACANLAETSQEQDRQKSLKFVSVTVDGTLVTYKDVPTSAWFALFVHKMIATGISTGYRNAQGTLTGMYGPENEVTLGELAKIAHRVVGIDETETRTQTGNALAKDTWSAPFFASAETHGWLIYQNPRSDPARPVTRAEVVATLLQAFDVPVRWPKGKMFTDIAMDTKFSNCIETAATDGLVSGFPVGEGSALSAFRPDQLVNRAELAKIVSLAIDLYGKNSPDFQPE